MFKAESRLDWLGPVLTWDPIVSDCERLGSFRLGSQGTADACCFQTIVALRRHALSLTLSDGCCCDLFRSGGRGRNRTFNLSIKSRMLCQLSYASGTNAPR